MIRAWECRSPLEHKGASSPGFGLAAGWTAVKPWHLFIVTPDFASVTLSATVANSRGDGRPMSSSRARRTAAMINAQMAMVEAKRSCSRASSCRALARRVSPM